MCVRVSLIELVSIREDLLGGKLNSNKIWMSDAAAAVSRQGNRGKERERKVDEAMMEKERKRRNGLGRELSMQNEERERD